MKVSSLDSNSTLVPMNVLSPISGSGSRPGTGDSGLIQTQAQAQPQTQIQMQTQTHSRGKNGSVSLGMGGLGARPVEIVVEKEVDIRVSGPALSPGFEVNGGNGEWKFRSLGGNARRRGVTSPVTDIVTGESSMDV